MAGKPRILCVGQPSDETGCLLEQLGQRFEVVVARGPLRALARLLREPFAAVLVSEEHILPALKMGKLLQTERILEGMPDGVVLLDSDNLILWANQRVLEWSSCERVVGEKFFTVLGNSEIVEADFSPFNTALASGLPSTSTLRSADNRYYRVHAAPVIEADGPPRNVIVTIRDVTQEVLQQQKLSAIHRAGIELAHLTAEELMGMGVDQRIELLKSNILHYTRDLLKFDVVEVRLLDPQTGRLEPLLSEGLTPEAAARELYALPQHNGVTGFVASTGKSYLCEDTAEDPLYLEGCRGAKSSLTVPLMLHDQVIGTFNVESPKPRAFSESDLQFLEIFARDVAAALNTLELLVAEQASTAARSVEAIHSAVALPIDEILNDAVNIMERYIGHEPEVVERLQRVLRNARDIKQMIQKVGQKMTPAQAHPFPSGEPQRPLLRGLQVLVVDADESVRSAAHAHLERYGCTVETAHTGGEAVFMIRNLSPSAYDVIISDIRLPDMTGYEIMLKLQQILDYVPLILMTEFGYDRHHSIVKARQAGLKAVLYKPFRVDQLLDAVELIARSRPKQPC